MTEQTKAQRLADNLIKHLGGNTANDAAAELRRLEQSEREGWRYADELEQERKRLAALNAELVEALQFVVRGVPDTWEGVQKAREVIAKAKEQT